MKSDVKSGLFCFGWEGICFGDVLLKNAYNFRDGFGVMMQFHVLFLDNSDGVGFGCKGTAKRNNGVAFS